MVARMPSRSPASSMWSTLNGSGWRRCRYPRARSSRAYLRRKPFRLGRDRRQPSVHRTTTTRAASSAARSAPDGTRGLRLVVPPDRAFAVPRLDGVGELARAFAMLRGVADENFVHRDSSRWRRASPYKASRDLPMTAPWRFHSFSEAICLFNRPVQPAAGRRPPRSAARSGVERRARRHCWAGLYVL